MCEVKTLEDYDFMPKLSARKFDNRAMVSPSPEDIHPFLDITTYTLPRNK